MIENYAYKDLFDVDSTAVSIIITDGTATSANGKVTITGATVTLRDEDIIDDAFSLEERLCSDYQLKFGACEAATLTFQCINLSSSLIGKKINVYFVLNNTADTLFKLGEYYVQSDKPNEDKSTRTVTAYDAIYKIANVNVASWYNSFFASNSTATIKSFRESLVAYLGLNIVDNILINDNVVIGKTITTSSITAKDVISAVCELNGAFGHITRNGSFEFKELLPIIRGLYPADDLCPADDLYPKDVVNIYDVNDHISAGYEDFETNEITTVTIRSDNTDVGVTVGDGNNAYIVEGNFLMLGANSTTLTSVANTLLSQIKFTWYRPADVEVIANPCFEVGDGYRIYADDCVIYSYILTRRINGTGVLFDTYSAAGGQNHEAMSTVSTQIKSLNSVTHTLVNTVDELNSEINDTSTGLRSQIQQTAGEVSAKVSKTGGTTSTFGWTLTDSKWSIYSNGDEVLAVDENGMVVNGQIGADGLITQDIDGDKTYNCFIGSGIVSATYSRDTYYSSTDINGQGVKVVDFDDNGTQLSRSSLSHTDSGYSLDLVAGTWNGSAASASTANEATVAGTAIYSSYIGRQTGCCRMSDALEDFIPNTPDVINLGKSNRRWKDIYALSGTINTSDRNAKKDIKDIDAKYLKMLLMLAPKSFQMINGTSGRAHIGFIAQDVYEAMQACGISDLEFAGWIKMNDDGVITYGLRYSEFIGLLTLAIQDHERRLERLEALLNAESV